MSRTFAKVTAAEFVAFVAAFPWKRKITEVHLHHTWRPRHSDYQGLSTIQAMWRFHTETNGWSDIGQHATIAPDGAIWLCRDFNWAPASAVGFNGNAAAGPFMIEMIGDFDIGQDALVGAQRAAAVGVIKAVQKRFKLDAGNLRFHNEMSSKSCPGNAVDKADLIKEIKDYVQPSSDAQTDRTFPRTMSAVWEAARSFDPGRAQPDDMSAAEHTPGAFVGETAGGERGWRSGSGLTGRMIAELSDHVINLERGQFSRTGKIDTDAGDVERIFGERLPDYIQRMKAAKRQPRLLFYAHGGLVDEESALLSAHAQLKFWLGNNIYPVFFIWETGAGEILRQMLRNILGGLLGSRGLLDDASDRAIEALVRAGQGGRIWGAMKDSAQLASSPGGGAAFAAERTGLLRDKFPELEVHAAGHSAGSIFHAHFMPALLERGVPIRSAHYLAPAIRNTLFVDKVIPRLGNGIERMTLFTMRKALELDDRVAVYGKSLLYLIHYALEAERGEPILGLEASLRGDPICSAAFGLGAAGATGNNVVWSQTEAPGTGSASTAVSHGGFDNDAPTMESVARLILGRVNGEGIEPFPKEAQQRSLDDFWSREPELPEQIKDLLGSSVPAGPAAPWTQAAQCSCPPSSPSGWAEPASAPAGPAATGPKRALCIGIDDYPAPNGLGGCVADAAKWQATLSRLGFQTEVLPQLSATASGIVDRIQALVSAARSGDHIVIQFSGHGTQFQDRDGEEEDLKDECLCAIDIDNSASGGLVFDDELRAIFARAAEGVQITSFFDCCHSGTITRARLRAAARAGTRARGAPPKARYINPTPAMETAYASRKAQLRAMGTRGLDRQRDVSFSACRANEKALERDGQGDFTRFATAVVAANLSNSEFLERTIRGFGAAPAQNPELDCDASLRSAPFLGL